MTSEIEVIDAAIEGYWGTGTMDNLGSQAREIARVSMRRALTAASAVAAEDVSFPLPAEPQHSDKLRAGLENVAKSLASRPRDLRGPFSRGSISRGDASVLRGECAASGLHDHDGCTCSDEDLLAAQAPTGRDTSVAELLSRCLVFLVNHNDEVVGHDSWQSVRLSTLIEECQGLLDKSKMTNGVVVLSAEEARLLADPCAQMLAADEPFFILLGRDPDAHKALSTWLRAREAREGATPKSKAAFETLLLFKGFRDARAKGGITDGR